MKNLLIWILLLCSAISSAQTRGLSMPAASATAPEGKTYALIVGISKYKNAAIPQLQYADKDAEGFKNYLLASGVDSGNIILLTNENARYADIMLDLDDLCSNKVKAGDKVFIYFSGHGDVESHVITNDGYLLPYDAPKIVYAISAINVKILQTYVATLSSKGVLAIVITDACHSGKLAGGVEGLKNIQTVLKENWKDEIKILSCQPGELSLEGKQWGGGRGLFSYELINGMAGMADKNNDGVVSLRELNLYLMDKIPDGANPLPQNPMLSGNMATNISQVNNGFLASLSSHSRPNMIASMDVKGMDESLLKALDDSIKEEYKNFQLAIASGNLYHTPTGQISAYTFYSRVPDSGTTKLLKAWMTRNYSVAIIRDLDSNLNLIVNNQNVGLLPVIVRRPGIEGVLLRQMLGDEKLKQIGLFTKVLFWDAYRAQFDDNPSQLQLDREMAIRKLDTCIAFSKNDAFTFFLRGHFFQMQGRNQEAINDFRSALSLSPRYCDPLLGIGYAYNALGKYDSAIISFRIASRDSNYSWASNWQLAKIHYGLNRSDSMNFYIDQMQYRMGVKVLDTGWLANSYVTIASLFLYDLQDYERAIEFNKKAPVLNSSFKPVSYYNISCCYSLLGNKPEALNYLEDAIKVGFKNFAHIQGDTDLDNIRHEPEFKALMKKYFPDQYKE